MWTRPSHKYQRTFGFVRKTNAYLNDDQITKFKAALKVENDLYNFALKYLYAKYGRKHIDRKFPVKRQKSYLVNDIKAKFIAKYYGLNRWKVKKLSLSSHNAQLFLMQLITNFAEYRKELVKNAKAMDSRARFNFKMNITKDKRGCHKNKQHKSWYRIGSIGFNADNRTMLIDLQPNVGGGMTVLSMHKIKIPDYGVVYIQGNAFVLASSPDIKQVRLKLQHDQTFQLQFVYTMKKPKLKLSKKLDAVGLDWNMINNEYYHDSNDQSFILPDQVVRQADKYEQRTNQLKSRRDRNLGHRRLLNKQISRLSCKRKQLLTEAYRSGVHDVVGDHQVIVIEDLDPKDMRQPGKDSGYKRGFNRKLALIKPYELKQILCNYAWKHGAVVIKVDAYKTSQVEYGTNFVQKHSLDDPRTWVSEYSEKTIKRDLNAAKNILDWGLHPDHHYKVRKFKKVEPEMVADFV